MKIRFIFNALADTTTIDNTYHQINDMIHRVVKNQTLF